MKRARQSAKNRFLLLYGSQTGQAKAIAEEIADTAPQFGLFADLYCLSLTEKKFSIDQESCVVFIVSTTGDGEPPDNAIKFLRRISKRTLDENYLKNVHYAVLALGDSNYSTFCYFGKQLEKALQLLSAKSFYSTGYADDAVGIETVADPWIANLFPAIRQFLGLSTECDSSDFSFQTNCHHFNDSILNLILSSNQSNKTPGSTDTSGRIVNSSGMNSIQRKEEMSRKTSIFSIFSAVEMINSKEFGIPALPPSFLQIAYSNEQTEHQSENLGYLSNKSLVVGDVKLEYAKRLTESSDVKDTLELTFKFLQENIPYQPGDSFGFICKNSEEEVSSLLERLGVTEVCDVCCKVSIAKEYSSKKKSVSHLPEFSTLKQIFTSVCEIRAVPKKILLRILLEYATDKADKLCLQFLCSQEGASLFSEYVRKPSLCLMDILCVFKSCKPPVERILEYLPPLKPRYYSVVSSPLIDSSLLRIVFNVVHISEGSGRCQTREGICTGWFSRMSEVFCYPDTSDEELHQIATCMSSLLLDSVDKIIHVFKRPNQHFYLPDDASVPIIMIGPGTGVAPFIGFLQHREQQMKNNQTCTYGETWLFYGCRYQKKDFLYREELKRLHSSGVLSHLIMSFSRDEPAVCETFWPRHVQDNLKHHAEEVVKVIDSGGKVFVCGDAKHMAPDVFQAFVKIMEMIKTITTVEAEAFIRNLEFEKRYVTDVWT